MQTLENPQLILQIDQSGCFNIYQPNNNVFELLNCELWVSGKLASGKSFSFPIHLTHQSFDKSEAIDGKCGLIFKDLHRSSGLEWNVEFWLMQNERMLFWQVTLSNRSDMPVFISQIGLLRPTANQAGNLKNGDYQLNQEEIAFFANGWQSWSFSAAYSGNQRMPHSRLGFLQEPMVLNPGTPKPKRAGQFSSDFFAVLGGKRHRHGMLLGFISQKQHYGTQHVNLLGEPAVRMWANGDDARLDPGRSMKTDVAVFMPLRVDNEQPLDDYLWAVAKEHDIQDLPSSPSGWCSWYQYYQNISDRIIRDNLSAMKNLQADLPLELLQIDDGFQSQVGDWLQFDPVFPNGLGSLSREIRQNGFTPGLWLAPFILHPAARTAREHPDWLLRTSHGGLVRAGFGWNSLAMALDLTVPAALDYACQTVHTAVHEWGYSYLKLDFLYAAALKGRYQDDSCTRAQVLRNGMQALREAAGKDAFLLGCGVPLGSVLGLVQGMRIGADVSAHWNPSFHGLSFPFRKEPHMPCVRNAIQNILTRAPFHQRWWVNDPDCLLVRLDTRLTLPEVQSLATAIAMTGGSVLLSDDLCKLVPERIRLAACLLPPINQRARIVDWLDAETPSKVWVDLENASGKWHLVALFNWGNQPQSKVITRADFDLVEDAAYTVRSFWDGKVHLAQIGKVLYRTEIAPHGVALLAVRKFGASRAQYMGSDVHISQGLEVAAWNEDHDCVEFELALNRRAQGVLDVLMPKGLKMAKLNGEPIAYKVLGTGCYRLPVQWEREGRVSLSY